MQSRCASAVFVGLGFTYRVVDRSAVSSVGYVINEATSAAEMAVVAQYGVM
ncbi:hypothetical protein [Mycobacterium sp.]|uniref:hypothetical protein n=1 Tax=Mycobacterium sp. TaxID=1785 RepID=UPI003BA8967C